jgi:hypothetical protein
VGGKGKGRAKGGAELGDTSQTATGKRGGKVKGKGRAKGGAVLGDTSQTATGKRGGNVKGKGRANRNVTNCYRKMWRESAGEGEGSGQEVDKVNCVVIKYIG